jgi:hypothetical protein
MNRRSLLGHNSVAAGLCLAGIAKTALAACTKSPAGPVAPTNSGKICGAMQGKALVFKGIPYGDTTDGAGRFQSLGVMVEIDRGSAALAECFAS